MGKHIISVLVENHSGVLSRVAGLFSRRGYNIDSLSVGETENPEISRMTIVFNGDEYIFEQVQKQLYKLIEVIKITELKPSQSVCRELMLIKVNASSKQRPSILEAVNIFRARVVDISDETLTVELTGDSDKLAGFIEVVKEYGILELVRTGASGIQRGAV